MKRILFTIISCAIFLGISNNSISQNIGIGTATPGSKLQVVGSFAPNYAIVTTSPYNIGVNDYYLVFNGGFSSGIFNLPAGTAAAKGRSYFIKNGAPNTLMVKAASGETIDGDTAVTLGSGEVAHIVMKGTAGVGIPTSEVVMVGQGSYSFFNAGLQGKAWSSKGNVGTNSLYNYIGTTDMQDLVTRTNGIERMRITARGKIGIGTNTPSGSFEVYDTSTDAGGFGVVHAEYKGTDAIDKIAVFGRSIPTSSNGIGVEGIGGRIGVIGITNNSESSSAGGVYGLAVSDNLCYGVYASASNFSSSPSNTKIGIYASASGGINNYAGKFDGEIVVNGKITTTSSVIASGNMHIDGSGFINGGLVMNGNLSVGGNKAFLIDHPLDPANKYLYHYCIESNEVLNVYSGNVSTGADGMATVMLPSYFESINKDFRYQLTVVGDFAQAIIKKKIAENKFVIETSKPNLEVSWMVTAVRNDKYMQAHPAQNEVEKEAENKGKYIHPIEWQQPISKAIQHEKDGLQKTVVKD